MADITRAAANPQYHLADGVVLGVGPRSTMLSNLTKGTHLKITEPDLTEALRAAAVGSDLAGWEDLVPWLLSEQTIAEGRPRPDPILRQRLGQMDQMFLGPQLRQLDERAQHAYALTLDAHARRKKFLSSVGQCPTLPETTLRRALRVGDADQVGPQHVLCVGDDDLVSVPLAALGHSVTVYDIDDYLLTLLGQVSREQQLSIATHRKDLSQPLAPETLGQFDCFVTDPMSNRDCFELFLSRAFALTAGGGIGYTAVFGPAQRLFEQICGEMKCQINATWARHNRYYSSYLKLHSYESDWVEIQSTPNTQLKHAPENGFASPHLYAEALHQRKANLVTFLDELDNIKFAKPFYLDMVVDLVEAQAGFQLTERKSHPGDGWSVICGTSPVGHFTLHVDRDRRQLSVELFPVQAQVEEPLRGILVTAYKEQAAEARLFRDRDQLDLRIR